MVDVVVLNFNDGETTSEFVEHVSRFHNIGHIVIVDNRSTDDSFEMLKGMESEKTSLIRSERNGGYGYGNNYGIRYLKEKFNPEFILLSNPDVIVEEPTITKMEEFLRLHSDYAIVAPFMCDKNGVKQSNSAFKLPTASQYIRSLGMLYSKYKHPLRYDGYENSQNEYMDVGAVSGSMFMFRTEAMIEYGMYDENIFLYCEEVVLGLKMHKARKKIALLMQETFIHNHSVSISKSFKSDVAKRKILNRSKLYVIRNYFRVNWSEYFAAVILSKVGIVETLINDLRH